ncbi:unnamed protein product [Allacma fusca]|uniref:Uncharacterized protein n=1 Tax=Allacma fusca TaxID=39272 RepID=A0A8J2L3W2_9HEXA|nr:unnamed protein product [Allacma fusca]
MIPDSEGRGKINGGNGPRWKIFIVEKNDKEVSHCWKNLQILTYVLVIVCGIASSKSMGDVSFMFSNKCIFNATLITEMGVNGTRFISSDNFDIVRWGEPSDCDFSQFYPVFSMACAGFLATFFAMCGRGGDTTRK